MPLIETKGAASAQGFGLSLGSSQAAISNYIEDVFSTYLFSGTDAYININNGINLLENGGLVWEKLRNGSDNHRLTDTARGAGYLLRSNTTQAEYFESAVSASAFYNNGFRAYGSTGETWASWTFRKQLKFFDVVTYTGNSTNRDISHSLGSVPGLIMVKRTDNTGRWFVYHKDIPSTSYLVLNTTVASVTGANVWNNTSPTSTHFRVGINTEINTSGGTYVAYLFAHDAGGFGLSGADNVISCGSYTGNGSATGPTVTLGWEPQWLLVKCSSSTGDWNLIDNMRGFTVGGTDAELNPNLTNAESTGTFVTPTATGFQVNTTDAGYNTNSATYIYIAIRRGPMKVPTSGTSVFSPTVYIGNSSTQSITGFGFSPDLSILKSRDQGYPENVYDRLRGIHRRLETPFTNAESTQTTGLTSFDQNGITIGSLNQINTSPFSHISWNFRRAPGFFDVVCYTGTGVARTVNHNLGVVPELMFVKCRNAVAFWPVYLAPIGVTKYMSLAQVNGEATDSGGAYWNNTTPTSSVFSLGTGGPASNSAGNTYVAYLFATLAGVSKVGSYTGTGTTLQINCGFTGGARFVMIKRTDSTGDWYVWDTARGIVAGNDPYFLLNTGDAEVTSTDYVDTYSAGFEISSTAPAAINANGGSFIFLAIA